jgi:hypothetical protein
MCGPVTKPRTNDCVTVCFGARPNRHSAPKWLCFSERVKYIATNKIDAPSTHIIRTYCYRWRIETFFEDSKQDLGLGGCEVRDSDGASRHWHLQMLTYSLLRLGPESSASERLVSKAQYLIRSFVTLYRRDESKRGFQTL